MSSSPHVFDVTLANFEQDVIARSAQTPVLLDFWATWCEPCKALGPTLERLADEAQGAFVVGKCDIDANPDLAQAFRVQSVPTVVLLVDGRPVDAFTGALPAAEIMQLLEPHLKAPAAPDSPLAAALELEQGADLVGALALLEPWLAAHPEDAGARIACARVLLAAGDSEQALEVYAQLSEADSECDEARALAARFELLEGAGDLAALSSALEAEPRDVAKRIEFGKALIAAGRMEEGLEELLTAAKRDLHFEDDAPRKAMLDVFAALGAGDPLTLEFQQRLSVLLCS